MDIPLLKAMHRELLALDAVVVVDVPGELALDRLVVSRGMAEETPAPGSPPRSRADRLEGADFVVDNSSDLAHLRSEVDRVWAHWRRTGPSRRTIRPGATPPAD